VTRLFAEPGASIRVGDPLAEFEVAEESDSGTVAGRLPATETRIDETAGPAYATRVHVKATPAVRALARKLDVDLASLDPTGSDGQITAEDVRRAAETLSVLEPPQPLRGVRRAMAQRMAQAHSEVVPATVSDEVD